MGQRLHVKYDAAKLSASAIADAVADTGMRAWLEHEEPIATTEGQARTRQILVAIAGAALGVGFVVEAFLSRAPSEGSWVEAGRYIPIATRKALSAMRVGALDINVLMLIAATGAIALGQWSEAATVVFLFAVAQALEARTLERARTAIRSLMDLAPTEAIVRTAAGDQRIDVDRVEPGAIVIVRPGEKIPLDGTVVAGGSAVNQAPVTGESLPIDKDVGDDVFAGTINGRGALEIRVTRVRRDTTLARIIHLVERAQAQRAPSQMLVERFARVYTPVVMALAAVVA
ncbi:MAG: heavy metal translocating P-type ATPase, partial [Acidobacteria bacterium]